MYAFATVETGDVTIPTATRALIEVAPRQTFSVTSAEDAIVRYQAGATGSVQGRQLQVQGVTDSLLTVEADSGYVYSEGSNARALVRWVGELVAGTTRYASGYEGAHLDVDGSSYSADAEEGAVITASGTSVFCQAYIVGTDDHQSALFTLALITDTGRVHRVWVEAQLRHSASQAAVMPKRQAESTTS